MNLFICFTPLQILISQEIIKTYHSDEFELLVLKDHKNKKLDFYIKNFHPKPKSVKVIEFKQFANIIERMKINFSIYKFAKNKKYQNIFFANWTAIGLWIVLNTLKFQNFYTFDDGAANITNYDQIFSSFKNRSFKAKIVYVIKKFVFKFSDFDNEYITKNSKMHYTIFENLKNVFNNTKFIKLFDFDDFSDTKNKKVVKIFLGQPIYESNLSKNKALIENLIDKFKIDFYMPHPREEYKIKNVNYIKTDLIIEDYIINEIKKDSSIKYEIYGFFSTSLFILSNMNCLNLNAIYIDNQSEIRCFKNLYEIMKNLGINIIEFEQI
ncbi:glycosyltransferase family 52 [Campylobacter portucalensis]|uniref:glycosyltransferase family 52 n=1 Tax=Campylobacter portucalensis TaxID=2608384 RepID=UPI0018A6B465|nr:glycosyltransferase family 52 [Campylobacter portucalensis]